MGNIPSFPFSPHTREAGFVCYVSHFGSADTLNNPCIILIPEREREREVKWRMAIRKVPPKKGVALLLSINVS